MRVEAHHLSGDDVDSAPSPNDGGAFPVGAPDTLILHFTALDSVAEAVGVLSDPTPGSRVSAHVVVGRDGGVTQLLPFDRIGWHAGRSTWGGRTEFNNFSVGIEIDNAGRLTPRAAAFVSWQGTVYAAEEAVRAVHRHEREPSWWHRFPAVQVEVVERLCALLVQTYGVCRILGHEEVAPERKEDPGPAFPLDELRRRLEARPLAVYDTPAPEPAA